MGSGKTMPLEELVHGPQRLLPLRLPARAVARAAAAGRTLDRLAADQHTSVRHIQRVFQDDTGLLSCSGSSPDYRASVEVL